MKKEADSGHHELMDSMPSLMGNRREDDYLRGVDELHQEKLSAAGQKEDGELLALTAGARVRMVREQKELSLQDVAQRTGLDQAYLQEIEEDKANPPLGVLVKLGKALELKLGTLIASGEDRPYTVVRVAERQDMSRYPHTRETSYGYSYQALAPKKRNRSMEPFMVTLRGGAEELEPSTHDGEEFIFVLEGAMEAVVGDAVEILHPGDCIYYDSTVPHLVRPHGQGPTLILAVIYTQDK